MELGNEHDSHASGEASAELADYLATDTFKKHLAAILPKHMATDRFVSVCLRQLSLIPDLRQCTLPSVIGGMMTAATLGLEIGTQGECWLLPYWRKPKSGPKVREAQLQIGVWGHMALAWRSEHIKAVQFDVVMPGDYFDWRKGTNPYLHHRPQEGRNLDNPDQIQWVYAVVHTTLGGELFDAFDHNWIERIRACAQSAHSPAWTNFYAEQAMAKALKRVLKLCPKSRDQARGVTLDDEADASAQQVWDVDTTLMLPAEVALDPKTAAARKAMTEMGKNPSREPEPVKREQKPRKKAAAKKAAPEPQNGGAPQEDDPGPSNAPTTEVGLKW